jgi:hypothetical protein
MGERSGKGSNLDASHSGRLIVVDLGVDEGDRSTNDVNTSSLRQHFTEGSRRLPSMGRWGNVPGKVQISLHLTTCQTWEIKREFQITSRNGAMGRERFKYVDTTPTAVQ